MMRSKYIRENWLPITGVVFMLLCMIMVIQGCTDAQTQQAQKLKDTADRDLVIARSEIAKAQVQIADLQRRAATMPADAQGRDEIIKLLDLAQKRADEAQAIATTAQAKSEQLQVVIDNLHSSNPNVGGLGTLIGTIPGVGPYASIIELLVGGVVGWYVKHQAAKKQMGAVLATWHNEDTPGTTPALNTAIAMTGVQPTPTKV